MSILLLASEPYFHTIDPVAIPITRELGVRWYGLSYAAGFAIAWLMLWWLARSNRSPLEPRAVGDLMFYAIVGVLVGGRLGHVFFYDPALLIDFSSQLPWWGVLAIHRGGMASHGGMIGVLIAVALFARRYQVPTLHVMDLGALSAPPGLFLGRVANFINGELLGRPVPDQQNPPSWSMKFPQEMRQWDAGQLAELRPIIDYAGVTQREWDEALRQIDLQRESPPRESVNLVYHAIERLIDSIQAGNEAVIEHVRPLLSALYPAQWMQAMTDGPILLGVLAIIWLRPRRPGIIAGSFAIVYGSLRIVTEMYRDPLDEILVGPVTRGQGLSALLVIAGIALVWWSARRDAEPMGGLLESRPPAS